jgi:coniferyl-aldehyde dehydrogenase
MMTISGMRQLLEAQKAAFLAEGRVTASTRIDRLQRVAAMLRENQEVLLAALSRDFGHRSVDHARLTEIAVPIAEIRQTCRQIERWMKDEKRPLPWLFALLGAKASIRYQPLGSVGVIVPWNFPLYLAFGPLIGIIAAGNRAMIKPSEFTPRLSAQLESILPRYFEPTEIAIVTGGMEVGAAFAELPFDHLVFTGAGSVARHVMAAAADLVPVTLNWAASRR